MRLLLHVGYPRSASTWLQQEVFGRPPFTVVLSRDRVLTDIVEPPPFTFNRHDVRRVLQGPAVEYGDGINVLSCERLIGSPHSGGVDAEAIAERVAAATSDFDVSVLFVVREQGAAIRSSYLRYLQLGGSASLTDYLREGQGHLRQPGFRSAFFRYDRAIGRYAELFGPASVRVVPMESLVASPEEALSAVLTAHLPDTAPLSTAPVNRSPSPAAIPGLLWTNRILGRGRLSPTGLADAPNARRSVACGLDRMIRAMPSALDSRANERFAEVVEERVPVQQFAASNRRLMGLTNLDLARWGYSV